VHELLNYNFVPGDLRDGDFAALYERRRRDSVFAFAYRNEAGETIALRDHIGIAPLYYRDGPGGLRFALAMNDLVEEGDELDDYGTRLFLAHGTAKLGPPVRGVKTVPQGTVIRFRADGSTEVLYEYRLPSEPLPSLTLDELADETDRLMRAAVERTVKTDSVGLYMSGGIDSALVAIYLKRAGVEVSAYTSAPWGEGGSDVGPSKMNVQLAGVDRHTIVPLDTADYARHVDASRRLYGSPHGVTTLIGVASLFDGSDIGDCEQVYLGHNTDTMTCSTGAQYLVYFAQNLPRAVRRRVHPDLCHEDVLSNFFSFQTCGYEPDCEVFPDAYRDLDGVRLLTLGAIYVTQTPAHSELLVDPVIQQGAVASGPYYDMDLVEFCLRLPRRQRISYSRSATLKLQIDKRVFRKVAERYLPPEIVNRKKAFTIPFARDEASRAYEAALPTRWGDRPLDDRRHRFTAKMLGEFARDHGIVTPETGEPLGYA
jgi:hypothetical protein